ncbi:branched-chain amino acid ABC transporter substrate-binding protein [Paramagnetospirillum marisnigri]|uniref:Branched-chain amino acid ABC transporter substrate-binding protein n=1 Tax=Paramagnetospirillum marisnigri TaxID=1285242 RepID=A0A178MK45_9PROT|nr:penicillin-binding protein activator [Paramagnetospirillum marisnigri]OAN49101.1 branched-chain amino acid ABC transporter substrate-binding protein [Paramagnetospirillum marisnigri]
MPPPVAKDKAPLPPAPPPAVASLPTVVPAPAEVLPAQPLRSTLPKSEVRAALLLPLSGPQAAMGQVLSNAAQLALFEVADAKFNLLPLDTKGTAEGAAAAAQQALAQGADIILGPVFSFEVKAAAPVIREQGIPLLAFTTDRSVAGTNVYAMGFLPGAQVARVLAHARDQGRTRIGVLVRSDDYGRAVAEAAKESITALGMELVALDYYDPAATEFTAVVKRFTNRRPPPGAKTPFDAVLVPDDGTRLRNIASLLTYFLTENNMPPPKLLGTLLWDDPRLISEPALEGGWYPAPPLAGHGEFEQRYAKAFGPVPPRSGGLAGIAYDAAALAAALARNGQGDYASATLQNPNGFAGVDGIFRLLPSGMAERGLTIKEISPQGSREVAPAPTAFGR